MAMLRFRELAKTVQPELCAFFILPKKPPIAVGKGIGSPKGANGVLKQEKPPVPAGGRSLNPDPV